MRKTINPQPNLREPWLELEHARELETISSLLDAHPKLNELVLQDLRSVTPPAGSDVGRGGMSAEQVSPGVVGEAAESVHLSGAGVSLGRLSKLSGRFASSAS